jgi:choline dehydrogenase
MSNYDFIVVGAGSAGSVIARRLSEAHNARTLVLEAGGTEIPANSTNPSVWFTLLGSNIDWGYFSTPQPGLNGRRTYEPRGKVIGGTGQLYIMMHIRGHPWDYDNWQYNGCPGWSYEQVLPYFKKMENQEDNTSPWAGHGGPMHVINAGRHDYHPLSPVFIESCLELGYPYTEDFNGPEMAGTGWHHINVKPEGNGVYTRSSPAVTYLGPALDCKNISFDSGAQATRLLFDGHRERVIGVEYVQDGQTKKAFADLEVVVCLGAIESPHLLLNSGIGPADQLRKFGKPVIADLPGVGENFHTHVLTGLIAETREPVAQGCLNTSEAALFTQSNPGYHVPDLQFNFVHLPFDVIVGANNPNSVSLIPGLQRPQSRGWVRLASSDPLERPLINPNYLSVDHDVQRMKQMVEIGREIFAAKPFRKVLTGRELLPGPDYGKSDAETLRFVRERSDSYHHQVGSCKMGQDEMAVVDPQLRVRGVEGLRVADASIMPTIVTGNIHAGILMVAEKAADMVKTAHGL